MCMTELARGALVAAADGRTPNSARAQLFEAAQQLRDWPLEGLSDVHGTEQLLQRMAALMQQYYALPAVAAERQLAVAQAAAGRSCAYLRCANLGGEGGPAAGQGVGSMRCRWVGRGDGAGARLLGSTCLVPGRADLNCCWARCVHADHCTPFPPPALRSACRAVWYCGTACSHADWREGGHRRVCKALGAARQAAKEAAAAAAAEERQ